MDTIPGKPNVVPKREHVDTQEGRRLWQRDFVYFCALLKIAERRFLNNRATAPALTKPIHDLLREGFDPYTQNDSGMTGFEILGKYVGGHINPAASSILRRLIIQGYKVMEEGELHHLQGPLLEDVVAHLSKHYNSAPQKSVDGSHHVHFLAEHRPRTLKQFLRSDEANKNHTLINRACLNEARHSDGKAVLHLLWGAPALHVDLVENEDKWSATYLLCKKGADLLQVDHLGVRPIDLIAHNLDLCPAPEFSNPDQAAFVLNIQPLILEASTRIVSERRPRARL